MSAGLFGFIYNTLLPRINNPENDIYWLPKLLAELDDPDGGGKLLPFEVSNWELGVTGTAGEDFGDIIATQWWLSIAPGEDPEEMSKHRPIRCSDSPLPKFNILLLTVNGLDNVLAPADPEITQSDTGYCAIINLEFGYYDGQNGLPQLSQFQFDDSQYSFEQCVCSALNESQENICDGWREKNIPGNGNFSATSNNVVVDVKVDIKVTGTDSGRKLEVVPYSLLVKSSSDDTPPPLSVDSLDLECEVEDDYGTVVDAFKEALTSQYGRQGLIENLNNSLNQDDILTELSNSFTQYLNQVFDNTIGKVPDGELPSGGGQAPNPVDQYLFDRVRWSLNDPDGDYYLPKMVKSSSNPQLEPYVGGTIELEDIEIPDLDTLREIKIENPNIVGFSNIQAPVEQLVLSSDRISGTLKFSSLPPTKYPSPLEIKGDFSFKPDKALGTISGSITITVKQSTIALSMKTSGEKLKELEITFDELSFNVDVSNIEIKIETGDSVFDKIVNSFFKKAEDVKQMILDKLNNYLSDADTLEEVSQGATEAAREVIAAQLDNPS
ncbi:MAG: hypothetical protein F6K31_02490 [Symploca sp. SIO2G7]|nr:hypothetical protein [Symploca sp. SIO2G7]